MPNHIAKYVHYYRKKSGLTQQELAIRAGVGKTVVFDIEKGKKSIQLDTLLKILDILNIKLSFQFPFPYSDENNKRDKK